MRRFRRSSQGQALAEYLIVLVLFALGAAFVAKTLPDALQGYSHAFFYMWSRPFP